MGEILSRQFIESNPILAMMYTFTYIYYSAKTYEIRQKTDGFTEKYKDLCKLSAGELFCKVPPADERSGKGSSTRNNKTSCQNILTDREQGASSGHGIPAAAQNSVSDGRCIPANGQKSASDSRLITAVTRKPFLMTTVSPPSRKKPLLTATASPPSRKKTISNGHSITAVTRNGVSNVQNALTAASSDYIEIVDLLLKLRDPALPHSLRKRREIAPLTDS